MGIMAKKLDDVLLVQGPTFSEHNFHHFSEMNLDRIYMDYNATTPPESEVIQAISEALQDAWGNPSSNYIAGAKAKAIINQSRENVARMVGGKAEDIIFTSGGTEANNLVLHTAVEHFRKHCRAAEQGAGHQNGCTGLPHIITSNVEHDSVKLVAQHLEKEGKADVTFVPVSKVTARVEVEDIIAAVRPNTCLISVMLANNETGVIMPLQEICQRIKSLNKQRERLRILLHTDAAQALGKIRVDVSDLGVDYLTIVGHKFYAPRIGALYVNGPGTKTPLYPMLFGGGQERNFRPGTENTPMIAGLGKTEDCLRNLLRLAEQHFYILWEHFWLFLPDRKLGGTTCREHFGVESKSDLCSLLAHGSHLLPSDCPFLLY
ncbi:selenocysteine lyase isoform X2 [Oreochromis aureus]|uniref:selenocysteine lyase isoform X2 n=1 Tax=Oreochromis aureus TaxID=47969 RepID=UPI00195388BF|nr:selenocysteine lyase isoform X2 [Oreochromis aureus]